MKHHNVIKVVAREIENIENKTVQEILKRKIEQSASRTGVQPHVHAIIQQEGMSHGGK